MQALIVYLLFPLTGYLLGAIPFGLIIGLSRGIDIRQHGSGNIGSTNTVRILGKKLGYLCFLLDVLKGLLPTSLVAIYLHTRLETTPMTSGDHLALLLTGGACVAGHIFPVYLKFKGGKGVATSLGMVLGIWPWFTLSGLAAFLIWVIVWQTWRYVSLASIVAAITFPVILFLWILMRPDWSLDQLWLLQLFAVIMATLVVIKHKSNVTRLLNGTESGGRKAKDTQVSK